MTNALDAAKYIAFAYKKRFGETISEMKLHKLLYFAQRESLIAEDRPLFPEVFEGWRFGPVIPSIRYSFADISSSPEIELDATSKRVIEDTLKRYGGKDPWSLSRLSHGEYSWQKSREGVSEYQNSSNDMLLDDIRIDAKRVKERREILSNIGIRGANT